MNAFSLTRHLLLKDLRHQRAWVALLWCFALLLPVGYRALSKASDSAWADFTTLTFGAFFLLAFLLLARAVLLDAPGRKLHFLATRPVPWSTLLAGKALFICVFLLAPVWVAKAGVIYAMKIPANAPDIALILAETTFYVGAIFGVVMLCALFLRNVRSIIFTLIAGYIAITVGLNLLWERSMHGGVIPKPLAWPLEGCQSLVFYIVIILTIGATAIFRYREKSLLKPLAVLAAGLALGLLARNFWPYDLSRLFPDRPPYTGEPPSPMRDHIKLTLSGKEGAGGNSLGAYGMWNHVKYVNFNHDFILDGVEPPYFAVLVDFHAVATLKSGRTIRSSYGDMNSIGGMGMITEMLRQKIAGFNPRDPDQWRKTSFEIFNYLPGEYANEDLTGASLKGELTLEIRRAFVIKTMPFKPGGSFDMPRRHYVIKEAMVTPREAKYQIAKSGATSVLRGDYPGFGGGWENLSWLVFNPGKGECLSFASSGGGGGGDPGFFCVTGIENGTLRRNVWNGGWKDQNEPLPADWGDGAEISFFSTEPCGRMTFPYEIKSVDLAH